ncbi:ATP-binding protein [Thermococcus sp. JCM 11816]|uniref:AAA family ATPase n=1 Tax=Thermococcus sp. (strain JCM 11816 / KS-1) TaxID=1295125 RepID=UPI000A4D49DE
MIRKFVDRERELEILEKEWRNTPSFVVIYGRRRVGKTRLLVEFSRGGKRAFFHTFMEGGTKESQIKSLTEELADFFDDEVFLSFSDWYPPLFKYLSGKIDNKTLLVFDEFTYAVKSDKGILSALQRVWDHELSSKPVMLVLSGSLMGMMEDEVLSHSSPPLYGRRTAGFRLRPLGLFPSLGFFEDFEEGLKFYMLLGGGVPAYLIIASRYRTVGGDFVEGGEFLTPEGGTSTMSHT